MFKHTNGLLFQMVSVFLFQMVSEVETFKHFFFPFIGISVVVHEREMSAAAYTFFYCT